MMTKAMQLLTTLFRRPTEFCDRAASSIEIRLEARFGARLKYETEPWDQVLPRMESVLGGHFAAAMGEDALAEIERSVEFALGRIPSNAPYPLFHNGDFRLARLCYACVRALTPASVIETGVCYGVTSAYILKALNQNGTGTLLSVDMPPLGGQPNKFVGWVIPQELKRRWQLFLGPSKKFLPQIVADLQNVEMFVHDSKHTYRNIWRELETVGPKLARQSVVIADDIEGNSAFLEWLARYRPRYYAAIAGERKNSLLGLAAFSADPLTV